ncbi:MAG TPA: hypothetical protein VN622_05635 [Clostridia bacterium]|nr:hypothetical protein [Clostridia bacterium]
MAGGAGRATFNKRQKERSRQEKQREKLERKKQKAEGKKSGDIVSSVEIATRSSFDEIFGDDEPESEA